MNDPSSLVDLLRKCHRDELEPLAAILRIKSRGMALTTLAKAIDLRLRRAATSEVYTLLRWGVPLEYPVVLKQMGIRLGLDVPPSPPLAELAIVRNQLRKRWGSLSEEEQTRRWAEVVADPDEVPTEPDQVITSIERRSPQGFGMLLTRLATEPIAPLPGFMALFWLARPRDDLAIPAVIEVCRLRSAVKHRVTVGIVGSPSAGKDAAMAAIFGIHTGNIDPVAGSTKQVEIRRLPDSTALYVVNTPGMGDVIEAVTEEARQVLDHIDVYLYLVNAQGGVQAREKADYEACRKRGRPVLVVVNKIDTLRPEDQERFLLDCRRKLGSREEDFLGAAFDPLPQLSETPIGVDPVRAWIGRELAGLGKEKAELPWVERAERQAV